MKLNKRHRLRRKCNFVWQCSVNIDNLRHTLFWLLDKPNVNFPYRNSSNQFRFPRLTFGIQRTKYIVRITCETYFNARLALALIDAFSHLIRNILFRFKYSTGTNLRNILLNFITLNEVNFFFKLKKIFLWITLHMYYATAYSPNLNQSKSHDYQWNLTDSNI